MVRRIERNVVELEDFAETIKEIQDSDRDVLMAASGFTGEGKSTFLTKLQKKASEKAGRYWGFDRLTWSREEMMTWIDGEKNTGKGRLPEKSAFLPDELITMFFGRNWHDKDQIQGVQRLNMCRDRHLFVAGAAPNFWDLDSSVRNVFRFYAYIPVRGVAWIFERENNPFTKDYWNVTENMKMYRKYKNPYSCPNFLCEIHFPDWDPEEKKEYLRIRNTKRVEALNKQKQDDKKESYTRIKKQRDALAKMVYNASFECKHCKKQNDRIMTLQDMADITGLSKQALSMVINSER